MERKGRLSGQVMRSVHFLEGCLGIQSNVLANLQHCDKDSLTSKSSCEWALVLYLWLTQEFSETQGCSAKTPPSSHCSKDYPGLLPTHLLLSVSPNRASGGFTSRKGIFMWMPSVLLGFLMPCSCTLPRPYLCHSGSSYNYAAVPRAEVVAVVKL